MKDSKKGKGPAPERLGFDPSPPDTQPYTVADIPGVTGRVIRLKVRH